MSGKEDRIRARAYELWERDQRAHGRHEQHWNEATRQVEQEMATEGKAAVAPAPRKSPARAAKAKAGSDAGPKPEKDVKPTAKTTARARKPRPA